MQDWFEIDFLNVEAKKSGDAIPLRYCKNGVVRIHVTDGGFQDTGEKILEHIKSYYENPTEIDSVVVTHNDGDHAGGLRKALEDIKVNELWMIRPWLFVDELLPRFSRYKNPESLEGRLKEAYPNLAALEKIAIEKKIPIRTPFQGEKIGDFVVMAPTKNRYLDLVVESDKTPDAKSDSTSNMFSDFGKLMESAAAKAISFVKAAWGVESFSDGETSAENNMSVVQFAYLCGEKILLTGDAGRAALEEVIAYAPTAGLALPGIDRFQVPHHGSGRNVSTEILDKLLGTKSATKIDESQTKFSAFISASKSDDHHPRKSVIRAMIHRHGKVISTEDGNKYAMKNIKMRDGWSPATPAQYPEEHEE